MPRQKDEFEEEDDQGLRFLNDFLKRHEKQIATIMEARARSQCELLSFHSPS